MSDRKLHFETLQLHVGQEQADPAKAKSDGAQSLTPDQFDTLMATIRPELEFFGMQLN